MGKETAGMRKRQRGVEEVQLGRRGGVRRWKKK